MNDNTQAAEALRACQSMCERVIEQYGQVHFGVDFGALLKSVNAALATPQQAEPYVKDREIREAVTALVVEANTFHHHGLLRERLARIVMSLMGRAGWKPPAERFTAEPPAAADGLPEPAAWRMRYRSEPGMIGDYPWSYLEKRLSKTDSAAHEYERLFTEAQAREAHELGRQQGMRQERAMWNLTRSGEEIDAGGKQVKTIHITTEISSAFEAHLNEQIDSLADGRPILRKETFPHNVAAQCSGIVEFAAGWHAALAAKPAQEALVMLTAEELRDIATKHPPNTYDYADQVQRDLAAKNGIGIKKDDTA